MKIVPDDRIPKDTAFLIDKKGAEEDIRKGKKKSNYVLRIENIAS